VALLNSRRSVELAVERAAVLPERASLVGRAAWAYLVGHRVELYSPKVVRSD
jgi:hypothetical protein